MAAMQGDLDAALEFEQRSLEIFEVMDDTHGQCSVLEGLGFIARQRGDLDAARGYFERILAMLRSLQSASTELPTISLTVNAFANLGQLAHERGEHDLAVAQLDKAFGFRRASATRPAPGPVALSRWSPA